MTSLLAILLVIALVHARPLNEFNDWARWKNELNRFGETLKGQAKANPPKSSLHGDPYTNIENYFVTMNACGAMQVPGSAFTIIVEGETVLQKAFGKSDVQNDVATTLDTLFPIGSLTKAITTTVVGSLVDDGLLDYDDEISEFIPKWYGDDKIDGTILDSFTMRLGFLRNNNLWFFNVSTNPADLVNKMERGFPSIHKLRYQWDYFNLGFAIGAQVASVVAKKPFSKLVKERFFDPLDLGTGAYYTSGEVLRNHPSLYAYPNALKQISEDQFEVIQLPRGVNTVLDGIAAPAGSIVMSIKAVTKYLTNFQSSLNAVVSPETFERITASRVDTYPTAIDVITDFEVYWHTYALGWVVGTYRGQKFYWHDGATIGHSTMFMHFPAQGISIGVLQNQLQVAGITNFFFGMYVYDQIMGYESLITPENNCLISAADPTQGTEIHAGLSPVVDKPRRYVGTYCNCLWKSLTVVENPDHTLKLTVGVVSGLLYAQNGNTFRWFGDDFPEPEEYTVTFNLHGHGGLTIDLNLEDGAAPVKFEKRANCKNICQKRFR